MSIDKIIRKTYPEISVDEFAAGNIELRDDGDGIQYISKWQYNKPIPDGLTLGKPNS